MFPMKATGKPLSGCSAGRRCVRWIQQYLGDCVCNTRDGVSLALGLISVISWGVAELPQILTNFKTKSTEGISLMFLITWFLGDLFNLAGCWLEPESIPTQFYMAVLYTITTTVLLWQSIYYNYLMKWKLPDSKIEKFKKMLKSDSIEASETNYENKTGVVKNVWQEPFKIRNGTDSSRRLIREESFGNPRKASDVDSQTGFCSTSPVTITFPQSGYSRSSSGKDHYYMSARSLGNSYTPTAVSYEAKWQGCLAEATRGSYHEEDDRGSMRLQTALLSQKISTPGKSKTLLCTAGIFFIVGIWQKHLLAYQNTDTSVINTKGFVLSNRRMLLQEKGMDAKIMTLSDKFARQIGTFMGWAMAAIYMGGRLPQIYLNIQRGTSEGLNPLMFIFALVGNSTYLGSILVRSISWRKIQPNMPWIVDAFGCVLLDCLVSFDFSWSLGFSENLAFLFLHSTLNINYSKRWKNLYKIETLKNNLQIVTQSFYFRHHERGRNNEAAHLKSALLC